MVGEILLVEDNDYNVDVSKQMLEFLGHHVTVASNGLEALSMIVARDLDGTRTAAGLPFDLVIMDCDMPIMNGFEATGALRRWERTGAAGLAGLDGLDRILVEGGGGGGGGGGGAAPARRPPAAAADHRGDGTR